MSEFSVLYSAIAKTGVISGLFNFQDYSDLSNKYRKLFATYSFAFSVIFPFVAANSVYSIIADNLIDSTHILVITASLLVLFYSCYFTVKSDRIHSLLEGFHIVTTTLTEDDLFKTDSESIILQQCEKFNSVFKSITLSHLCITIAMLANYYINRVMFGACLLYTSRCV